MVKIPSEVLEIIDTYIRLVRKDIKVKKVILFGSYAKGKNNSESDIDIALIIEEYNENEFISMGTFLLDRTEGLKVDLQPLPFSEDEYNNPKGIMEEIINTGIELKIA